MIKKGRFAWYKGYEYDLTRDMEGNYIIITEDKSIIDDTFIDEYNSGVFSKIISISELDRIYEINTYGIVQGQEVGIRKERDGEYLIFADHTLAMKLGLERVDKYGYEGWISADKVEIVVEEEEIK